VTRAGTPPPGETGRRHEPRLPSALVRKFPTQKPRNCRSKPRNPGDHANVSH
jgi:hypothetical protein